MSTSNSSSANASERTSSPVKMVPQTAGNSAKSGKSEAEIKEEEELQLAIALSQSEAEEKEKQKLRSTSQILNKTGWCLLLILGFLSGKRAKKLYDLRILV